MKPSYKKLQKEREKLDRLVDEALVKGTPISKTPRIIKQCKKLNDMMIKREGEDLLTG